MIGGPPRGELNLHLRVQVYCACVVVAGVLCGQYGHYYCILSYLIITTEMHMSVPCGEAGRPYVHGPAGYGCSAYCVRLGDQDRQDLVEPELQAEICLFSFFFLCVILRACLAVS